MPYDKNEELPDNVKDNLPKQAQTIYLKAFNSAFEEYEKSSDRRGEDTRETTAHKVAWAAVSKTYEKRDGQWVKKNT